MNREVVGKNGLAGSASNSSDNDSVLLALGDDSLDRLLPWDSDIDANYSALPLCPEHPPDLSNSVLAI